MRPNMYIKELAPKKKNVGLKKKDSWRWKDTKVTIKV